MSYGFFSFVQDLKCWKNEMNCTNLEWILKLEVKSQASRINEKEEKGIRRSFLPTRACNNPARAGPNCKERYLFICSRESEAHSDGPVIIFLTLCLLEHQLCFLLRELIGYLFSRLICVKFIHEFWHQFMNI